VTVPTSHRNARLGSYLSGAGDFTMLLGASVPAGTYVVRNLNLLAGVAVDVEGPVTFYVTRSVNLAAGVNLFGSTSTDAANFKVRVADGGSVNFLANLLTPGRQVAGRLPAGARADHGGRVAGRPGRRRGEPGALTPGRPATSGRRS
jgi:hypothetical protein